MSRIQHWVWMYYADGMIEEVQGWRHPVWIGSAGWEDDEGDGHYANTLVVRVPFRRYVVIKLPFKRRIRYES